MKKLILMIGFLIIDGTITNPPAPMPNDLVRYSPKGWTSKNFYFRGIGGDEVLRKNMKKQGWIQTGFGFDGKVCFTVYDRKIERQ